LSPQEKKITRGKQRIHIAPADRRKRERLVLSPSALGGGEEITRKKMEALLEDYYATPRGGAGNTVWSQCEKKGADELRRVKKRNAATERA